MQAITTIGLDIAKSVFQVHGVDAESKVVIRRQLKRRSASVRARQQGQSERAQEGVAQSQGRDPRRALRGRDRA